jgi:hypothetical protein
MPTASVAPANAALNAQLIARLRGLAIFAPIALLENLVGAVFRYPDIGAAIFFPPYAALAAALLVTRRRGWVWYWHRKPSMHWRCPDGAE